MPAVSPFQESQKLIRCQVTNRYRETSTRFIELNAYKLWEYLMTTKHGLRVGEPHLCLWVEAAEYQDHATVFERAGDVEPVDRIVVDMFDAENGFSQTITRYARASESDQVVGILRSHIPPELATPESCQIEVINGQVVQQWHANARRDLVTGLEG